MDKLVLSFLAVLHGAGMILVWRMGGRAGKLKKGELLFCALLPLFGPACGYVLIKAPKPEEGLLQDMIMREDPIRRSYTAPGAEATSTVPMEEAFLIDEPQVRREMMMKLVGADPERNIELLMMARFNDDPETAHYATATLTEYQRRIEMELQESQMLLGRDPENLEDRVAYIQKIQAYIDTGLLEGHLLTRQRRLMEKEFERIPQGHLSLEMGCLRARNLLSLHQAREAEEVIESLIRRFPGAEEPWLERMRIAVEMRDAGALKALRDEAQKADVMWSYQGQEKMAYILRGFVS